MVRALCAEIPPHEAIGTFETEYELHLHEMPDQHPIVHAWEARPGSGSVGPMVGRPVSSAWMRRCTTRSGSTCRGRSSARSAAAR